MPVGVHTKENHLNITPITLAIIRTAPERDFLYYSSHTESGCLATLFENWAILSIMPTITKTTNPERKSVSPESLHNVASVLDGNGAFHATRCKAPYTSPAMRKLHNIERYPEAPKLSSMLPKSRHWKGQSRALSITYSFKYVRWSPLGWWQ